MAAKYLIIGLPNSGKTYLTKDLKDVLVFSRDGKPYPFTLPHRNLHKFSKIDELFNEMNSVVGLYKEQKGKLPATIVIDSVSRIGMEIENNCSMQFNGFDVWSNVNKQMTALVDYINNIHMKGINVVILSHAVMDTETKTYTETSSGKFGKVGFISIVDHASLVELVGSKRVIHHKNKPLARSMLLDIPDKQDIKDYDLQKHIDKINEASHSAAEWELK